MIINRLTLLAATIALSVATPGAAARQDIDVQHSTITVRVFKSGLFRAFADNHVIQAPVSDGWVDDSATPQVDVIVAADRMRVLDPGLSPKDREAVQARMLGPEVLDASRFGRIRFHSTAVQRLGTDRWLVRGILELHGQEHEMAVDVAREAGRYRGSAKVRQSDFAISPVSVAGGTVKVKDEVVIEFDIVPADR